MRGRFLIEAPVQTITAANGVRTLLEFTAPSDQAVEVLGVYVENEESETSTQEVLEFVYKSAAGTGTGSATITALTQADPGSFGGSARYNCTAEGTVATQFHRRAWNIVGGFEWAPTPNRVIIVKAGGIFGVRVAEALEASTDILVGIEVRVLG